MWLGEAGGRTHLSMTFITIVTVPTVTVTTAITTTQTPLSRYDGLVGMFDPKGRSVPCVGVSRKPLKITAHCTLHTAHCTLHTAHCTLHTAHCTVHTVVHCTLLCIVHLR